MEQNDERGLRHSVITRIARRSTGVLGRTTLMKLVYLLQEAKGIDLGYRFSLYSYGPFDADVLNDLDSLCAQGEVTQRIEHYPKGYGYRIEPVEATAREEDDSTVERHAREIDWVVAEFGGYSAVELELMTTILYVDREYRSRKVDVTDTDLLERVSAIKPKFPPAEVRKMAELLVDKELLQLHRQGDR